MNELTIVRILADGLIVPIVIIGAYAIFRYAPRDQRYQSYCRILMAGITALLVAKLFGTLYQPSELRPFVELGVSPGAAFLDNPGFPSDHVLLAAVISFAVLIEIRMKSIALVLIILTFLMGLGRVLALVHTPLDITGGVLIAAVGALWYVNTAKSKNSIATIFARHSKKGYNTVK